MIHDPELQREIHDLEAAFDSGNRQPLIFALYASVHLLLRTVSRLNERIKHLEDERS